MARSAAFQLAVITPEQAVLECEATFVTLPAHDGEIGILRNRAPLLCKLEVGRLRADTDEGKKVLYVDGGFAEMVHNRLTVLTQEALTAEELDRAKVDGELAAARAMRAEDEAAFKARQRALKRARTQLRMLR